MSAVCGGGGGDGEVRDKLGDNGQYFTQRGMVMSPWSSSKTTKRQHHRSAASTPTGTATFHRDCLVNRECLVGRQDPPSSRPER